MRNHGSALILIVIMLALLSLYPVVSQLAKMGSKNAAMQEKSLEADNVAKSGLMDAISWFQRQGVQPVRQLPFYVYPDGAFHPRFNADPALSSTTDESIGLVNVYDIDDSKGLKARYEVRRQPDNVTFATNPVNPSAVHDITHLRVPGGAAGDGLVWTLESTGYVYREKNPAVPFNTAPNEIVGKSIVNTEIWALQVDPPARAALSVDNIEDVDIVNGFIRAPLNNGISHFQGDPVIAALDASVAAQTLYSPLAAVPAMSQVFGGIDASLMKHVADVYVRDLVELPSAGFPLMSLAYIQNPNVTISGFKGSGILVVDGNLTLTFGWPGIFKYNGLIYVDGDLTIQADLNEKFSVTGGVIATGRVNLQGNNLPIEIIYDENMINSVKSQIARYRQSKPTYFVSSALKK